MIKKVNIHIGGIYVSSEPVIIETLLGSCVSVCMFDPIKKVGGMNHILLPGNPDLSIFNDSARYGMNAMEMLITGIVKSGGVKRNLQTKIFGGGHILQTANVETSPGPKNVEFVIQFLEMENIPIISQDTGGYFSRKIIFNTDSLEALVRRTESAWVKDIDEEERKYINTLIDRVIKKSNITLF